MKIKPEFTEAQAGIVRVALKTFLEEEWDAPSLRAARNALDELDRAQQSELKGDTDAR